MKAKSCTKPTKSHCSCWWSRSTNRLVTLLALHRSLNTTQHSCYFREPFFPGAPNQAKSRTVQHPTLRLTSVLSSTNIRLRTSLSYFHFTFFSSPIPLSSPTPSLTTPNKNPPYPSPAEPPQEPPPKPHDPQTPPPPVHTTPPPAPYSASQKDKPTKSHPS